MVVQPVSPKPVAASGTLVVKINSLLRITVLPEYHPNYAPPRQKSR